jgi:hypothetical protein
MNFNSRTKKISAGLEKYTSGLHKPSNSLKCSEKQSRLANYTTYTKYIHNYFGSTIIQSTTTSFIEGLRSIANNQISLDSDLTKITCLTHQFATSEVLTLHG